MGRPRVARGSPFGILWQRVSWGSQKTKYVLVLHVFHVVQDSMSAVAVPFSLSVATAVVVVFCPNRFLPSERFLVSNHDLARLRN